MKLYYVGNKDSEAKNSYFAVASCRSTAEEAIERHAHRGADRVIEKNIDVRPRRKRK